MDTLWGLTARYKGLPLIPIEQVRLDFFPGLTPGVFLRKLKDGDIKLPVVMLDRSQKGTRSIPVKELAAYIDRKTQEAVSSSFYF